MTIWEKIVRDAANPAIEKWTKPASVKECSGCKQLKPFSDYYAKATYCKTCSIKRVMDYKKRKKKEREKTA